MIGSKKLSKWLARHSASVETVDDPRHTDLVIPVMGPTGVGKSTFINYVVGKPVMDVGHDLQSCTSKIEHVIIPHPSDPSRRIVFVDTPGFDDTYVADAEILKHIAVWLAKSYYDGMKLAGIVYLHEISQTRMFGTTRKNLTMFNKLCGDDALKNVVLATTKWSDIPEDVGHRREEQLANTYWKRMLNLGSRMAQFTCTRESAWAIVNPIIFKNPVDVHTLIQEELVDLQKHLSESEAGKTLRYTLEELLELQRDMARQLREETQGSEELQERQEEISRRLTSTLHQIQELKVPLSRRIATFLFSRKEENHAYGRPSGGAQFGGVRQVWKACERASVSDDSGDSDYKDSIWSNSNDGTSSSVSSVEPSPHEAPRVEGYLYYAGLGSNGRGPKLIYRTSNDKFVEPEGPGAYKRLMKLSPVPEDHELGQDGRWDRIRNQVVELLDKRGIKLTSVDLVQFTWLDKKDNQEIQEEEEEEDDDDLQNDNLTYDDIPPIKPIEDGKRHTTNPTIWVGVLPDTLTGAVAHESATEILGLLKELGIAGVDVAYRESVAKFLHGPDLFAPVSDLDPLKDVIDNLSTLLSLPIAGRKTTMQGTLGYYFRVGDDLYAATARHNVFSLNGDNEEYNYVESAPKKEVVVIGNPAFTNYLASIQANIGTLNDTVDSSEKRTRTLTRRVEAGGNDAQKSAGELAETQDQLTKTVTKIDALKAFFVDVKKRWSKLKDRVIGYVVWTPPIGVGVPHRYTRDLCVIKLDKKKFRKFRGNVLSLGPEISPAKFKALMYDHIDMPSKFEYPEEGLLPVQGMLSSADINNPNGKNLEGERIRRIIKRGFTTNTTVGTLSMFMSHSRKYFATGNLDSVEVAILPHDNDSIAFSRGGDSGALIVDALGRFVALLTGGTNKGTDSSDITFATLMEWVWDLIKDKFPGADLYFDDLEGFLADVV